MSGTSIDEAIEYSGIGAGVQNVSAGKRLPGGRQGIASSRPLETPDHPLSCHFLNTRILHRPVGEATFEGETCFQLSQELSCFTPFWDSVSKSSLADHRRNRQARLPATEVAISE